MLDEERIQQAVQRYEREYDRYAKLAARVADICRAELVEANALRAQVTFRAKSPRSFEGKLRRKRERFGSVDEVFGQLPDLAAARIATYEKDDELRVVRELRKRFIGPDGATEAKAELKDKHEQDSTNFYRATHLEVVLPERDLIGVYANLRGTVCEVQVCSMMAHVWNEIEHDLGYKPTTGTLSHAEYELLSALGRIFSRSVFSCPSIRCCRRRVATRGMSTTSDCLGKPKMTFAKRSSNSSGAVVSTG